MNNNSERNISKYIETLFTKPIIDRVKLVIQHGIKLSKQFKLASKLIEDGCDSKNIRYATTSFFHNRKSKHIQTELEPFKQNIKEIFTKIKDTTSII